MPVGLEASDDRRAVPPVPALESTDVNAQSTQPRQADLATPAEIVTCAGMEHVRTLIFPSTRCMGALS
jgi:hypothetical protein